MCVPPLPDIKIVKHVRATRLRLRVEFDVIRLTVPVYCSEKQVQQFLLDSQEWLDKTWTQQHQTVSVNSLSDEIQFFNQTQPFKIIHRVQRQKFEIDENNFCIYLKSELGLAPLKEVVVAYAKQYLPHYLQKLSQETQLNYKTCQVRTPKTRWGSCSAQHKIMLHAGLVLMKPEIARYVCIHELAHTRHFDHSPHFWQQVKQFDLNYMQHRQHLKQYRFPAWWYLN